MSSATSLARRYRSRELSPVEATQQALAAAEAEQPRLNAFITLLPQSALEEARAAEERFRRNAPLGPLDGVPVAIKDLFHMRGVPTTCASKVLAGFVPDQDAEVIRRLRNGGAVLIGKTNLHEFAYGSTGEASAFGPSRNPRNPEYMTGGSSSGSAAAVGAHICPIALGSDTACSIRTPASLCGIVGLKPTYGLVPIEGVIPLSWSQDHIGPMTSTVEDAALALSVLAGIELPELRPAGKLRIGLCRELFFQHLDADVRRAVEGAIARLGEARQVQIGLLPLAGAAQTLITAAEAGAFHKHWLEARPDGYDWSVRNRLEAAREVGARDYVQALRLRGRFVREMAAAFAEVDVLAMPTTACPAPKLGQRQVELEDTIADATALLIRNAAPMNFSGFPAISVPCGESAAGLPIGLQLVAQPWQEARLLEAAYTYQLLSSR
ncbi:MAG TPA: amidase [Chloroflexota bacterium]